MKNQKLEILFVEDNKHLLENFSEYFKEGYDTDFASDGLTALHLIANHQYDVIVLDVMLPGINGFDICKKIRQDLKTSTPVILLTALGTIENKIEGFGVGADDYLCKPFDMRELELRIQSFFKKTHHKPGVLSAGDVSFHAGSLTVSLRDGRQLPLSGLNATLFEALIQAHPSYLDYETISTRLWGTPDIEENTIRTHVYTLRKLIKQQLGRSMIRSIYGRGYQLDPTMK